MNTPGFSKVEQAFFNRSGRKKITAKMPYVLSITSPASVS
jgi:hypothetical protein